MTSKYKIVKDHFDSVASFYYSDPNEVSPNLHIFSTRFLRITELVGDLIGLNVLAVGCGPAPMAGYILENGGGYFGIDLSKGMLHEAKKRYADETISLSQGNMVKLPFRDATFDVLLCLGVLEYIEDINLALKEFSRVLKNGGIIIISMQNKYSLYRLWDRFIYSGFLFNTLRKLRGRSAAKLLENSVSLRDLRDTMFCHSLVELDHLYYNYNLWLKPLDRLFPRLSVATSKRLEFLYRSNVGILPADFIIKAQKVTQVT